MDKYIRKYSIENWEESKEHLLIGIDTLKDAGIGTYGKATFSDYSEYPIEGRFPIYKNVIMDMIHDHLMEYCHSWCCDRYTMEKMWFMEYSHENSQMEWHNHPNVNMSGVIQVTVEGEASSTEFLNSSIGNELKEGDLLLYPSMVPHRSAPFKNGNKLIVAFDWNMWGSTLHNIYDDINNNNL